MQRHKERKQHPVNPVASNPENVECTEDSLNTTIFNESIFGPIREHHRKKTKPSFNNSWTTKVSISKDSDNKGSCSFERMILSMEDSKKKRERKIDHLEFGKSSLGPEYSKKTWKLGEPKRSKLKENEHVNQHTVWKNFVSGKNATVTDASMGPTREKMNSHAQPKQHDKKV